MPYTRSNGLRGTGRRTSTHRRRPNALSKVKYQAPTAKNQKKQIMRNTRLVNKVARVQASKRIYTDYQYTAAQAHVATNTWAVNALTDFGDWEPVLRVDPTSESRAQIYVRNLSINLRFNLNNSDYAYISCFIVTMRRNSAGIDPLHTLPTPNIFYVSGLGVPGANLRLNPAIYKVHYAKYLTLTANSLGHAAITDDTVGNPNTTWRKAQVNIPCKMNVRNPALFHSGEGRWVDVGYNDLPYYQRYFLMTHISYGGTGAGAPLVAFDQLATCVSTA